MVTLYRRDTITNYLGGIMAMGAFAFYVFFIYFPFELLKRLDFIVGNRYFQIFALIYVVVLLILLFLPNKKIKIDVDDRGIFNEKGQMILSREDISDISLSIRSNTLSKVTYPSYYVTVLTKQHRQLPFSTEALTSSLVKLLNDFKSLNYPLTEQNIKVQDLEDTIAEVQALSKIKVNKKFFVLVIGGGIIFITLAIFGAVELGFKVYGCTWQGKNCSPTARIDLFKPAKLP